MEPNEPKYKPRRTRGTPSYFYRNVFAVSGLAIGALILLIFESIPANKDIKARISSGRYLSSPEEIERRNIIRSGPYHAHPRESILKSLKEEEERFTLPIYGKESDA